MAEIKIDNGYVELWENGAQRCRFLGGGYVTDADVTLSDGEIRVRGSGFTNVYDWDGVLRRTE